LGIKIFNSLPLEIKKVAVNQKKFKIALKKFFTLIHFTQWNITLANRELYTVPQDFIVVVHWLKNYDYLHYVITTCIVFFSFCLGTLCKYFIDCIFWTDHISLCKLDLSYLYIIITNHYHTVSYCQDSFCTVCCYVMTSSISTLLDPWNTK